MRLISETARELAKWIRCAQERGFSEGSRAPVRFSSEDV